jgi:hypothetical protein
MLTCCVAELQSQHRRHQQSEQQDQLRREMRGVWAKARKACLCLLLETAGRPYLGDQAAADAARLSFDYSRISSSGRLSDEWSELPPKDLEEAAYPFQVDQYAFRVFSTPQAQVPRNAYSLVPQALWQSAV